ncbi:unnamed protein product, partial [Prorocentrum cordatum]
VHACPLLPDQDHAAPRSRAYALLAKPGGRGADAAANATDAGKRDMLLANSSRIPMPIQSVWLAIASGQPAPLQS